MCHYGSESSGGKLGEKRPAEGRRGGRECPIVAVASASPDSNAPLAQGRRLGASTAIRTEVNLIPETVTEIRVVDIVGLDKQADGGTHVARTDEVGRIRVLKTESKGKGTSASASRWSTGSRRRHGMRMSSTPASP